MYAASVAGRSLAFDVYGVWRKNMVMNDRETSTIWQHATGEALDGPLQGSRLEVLPAWETTWGALQASQPQACFAVEPPRFTGLMPKPVLTRLLKITHKASLSGLSPQDARLDAHAVVIGLVLNGAAKAYPLSRLRAAGTLRDTLAGQEILLQYDPQSSQVTICTSQGLSLPYERQWWLGWSEFHPRSAIFEQESR